MYIAILGGSFDPPHFGHLLAARQILDFTKTDEVWLMPCFSHPFDKNTSSVKHRLAMAKLCSKGKIKVSDWEIKQKKISYSINTLNCLSQKFPQHKFSFIIGSEQVKDFKKWKDWQQILKKYKIWIFPRDGLFAKTRTVLAGMVLVRHRLLVTSALASTKIRKRARKGLDLDYFVPEKVEAYIKKHNLYKDYKNCK